MSRVVRLIKSSLFSLIMCLKYLDYLQLWQFPQISVFLFLSFVYGHAMRHAGSFLSDQGPNSEKSCQISMIFFYQKSSHNQQNRCTLLIPKEHGNLVPRPLNTLLCRFWNDYRKIECIQGYLYKNYVSTHA